MEKLLNYTGLSYFLEKLKNFFIIKPKTGSAGQVLVRTEDNGAEWSNLPSMLTYKGSKPTIEDLPTSGNQIGDVWSVGNQEYFCKALPAIWEQLGPVITTYTEGDGIHIENNVIQAKVDGDTIKSNEDGELYVDGKQNTLVAGKLITIEDNEISAEVPTAKNQLIYSDNGQSLNTHQLLYQEGLVVDTAEDLEKCKEDANISMSVILRDWISYGDQNDSGRNKWGYCDSTGTGTQQVTLIDGTSVSVPVFKYNQDQPEGYIFNTLNTTYLTGYRSNDKYSKYNQIIASGVEGNQQWSAVDYLAVVPALAIDLDNKGYGISLFLNNTSNTGSESRITVSGNHTIELIAWKQNDINQSISNSSSTGVTNIDLINAATGLTICPHQVNMNNGTSKGTNAPSVILSHIIRNDNVITIYISDAYSTSDDDYDHLGDIHYDRPIVINLDDYSITYTDKDGNTTVKHSSDYSGSQSVIEEIFDQLKGSAYRGFETLSNPGTIFRSVTNDELILDIVSGHNKVYKFDGEHWIELNTTPQAVLKNGSRLAWNRITDKLFYNDGTSIYRISASNSSQPANDGILSIKADNTEVVNFTANSNVNKNVNIKSGAGIDIQSSGENSSLTINTTPIYKVQSREEIYSKDPSATGSNPIIRYKYIIESDNTSNSYLCVNKKEFLTVGSNPDTTTYRPFKNLARWEVTSAGSSNYLGLMHVYNMNLTGEIKLNITHDTGAIEHHSVIFHVHTPPAGTITESTPLGYFTLITTCDWEIIVKRRDTGLKVYVKVPNNFTGIVSLDINEINWYSTGVTNQLLYSFDTEDIKQKPDYSTLQQWANWNRYSGETTTLDILNNVLSTTDFWVDPEAEYFYSPIGKVQVDLLFKAKEFPLEINSNIESAAVLDSLIAILSDKVQSALALNNITI